MRRSRRSLNHDLWGHHGATRRIWQSLLALSFTQNLRNQDEWGKGVSDQHRPVERERIYRPRCWIQNRADIQREAMVEPCCEQVHHRSAQLPEDPIDYCLMESPFGWEKLLILESPSARKFSLPGMCLD